MRNAVLCEWAASDRGLHPAFAVVYVEGPGLPFADKMRGKGMADFTAVLRPETISFGAISYQRLLAIAGEAVSAAALNLDKWQRLREWVDRKIEHAMTIRGTKRARQ